MLFPEEELKRRVDEIISHASDDERAHSEEDDLHQDLIKEYCPPWVIAEVERLNDASFARWCA